MNQEEIKKFEEKIKKLTIVDLVNEELMKELTNLLILISDIFAICKIQKETDYLKYQKIRQAKDIAIEKRMEIKNEKIR